jgi:glycosyltransferase involved in cell wall biosynthesis
MTVMSVGNENICCIVPAHNEAATVARVIQGIRKHLPGIFVVDDGSDDDTAREAEAAGATILRHPLRRGKGEALKTGFSHALRNGATAAMTLDADGQHDTEEIPRFIEAYRQGSGDIIIGSRMAEERHIPLKRKLANKSGTWFMSLATGMTIPDTQSGFRLYGHNALALPLRSSEFETELEVLLRAARAGLRIASVPVRAIYPESYSSHFRPVRDYYRISIAYLKTVFSLWGA